MKKLIFWAAVILQASVLGSSLNRGRSQELKAELLNDVVMCVEIDNYQNLLALKSFLDHHNFGNIDTLEYDHQPLGDWLLNHAQPDEKQIFGYLSKPYRTRIVLGLLNPYRKKEAQLLLAADLSKPGWLQRGSVDDTDEVFSELVLSALIEENKDAQENLKLYTSFLPRDIDITQYKGKSFGEFWNTLSPRLFERKPALEMVIAPWRAVIHPTFYSQPNDLGFAQSQVAAFLIRGLDEPLFLQLAAEGLKKVPFNIDDFVDEHRVALGERLIQHRDNLDVLRILALLNDQRMHKLTAKELTPDPKGRLANSQLEAVGTALLTIMGLSVLILIYRGILKFITTDVPSDSGMLRTSPTDDEKKEDSADPLTE